MPSGDLRFVASTVALSVALVVLATLFVPDPTGRTATVATVVAALVAVVGNGYRYYA